MKWALYGEQAMPRANPYRITGQIWHITDRYHRQQFLLKFARDRRAWVEWLYEARKHAQSRKVKVQDRSVRGSTGTA